MSPGKSFFNWTFPGCPVRVSLGLAVVEAVQRDVASNGGTLEAAQGVLLGYIVNGSTRITSFLPVTDLGEPMSDTVNSTGRCAVGFYRIRSGDALQLDEDEIVTARDMFQRPGSVILLVQRRPAGTAEATFFFFERNLLCGGYLHFPFDARFLAERELRVIPSDSARLREMLRESPLPALPPAKACQRAAPAQPRAWRKAFATIAFAVLAMAGGAALTQAFRPPTGAAATKEIAIVPVQAMPASRDAGSRIEIHAQRHGKQLTFTWDPALGSPGSSGTLSIVDGDAHRLVPLERGQLQAGRLPYTPTSDQVNIDLAISHGTLVDARGTLLVLLNPPVQATHNRME